MPVAAVGVVALLLMMVVGAREFFRNPTVHSSAGRGASQPPGAIGPKEGSAPKASPPLSRLPREITSPSTGLVLVRIEPGWFMMGPPDADNDAYDDQKPPHGVRITRPFYLGKYEVTQAEYKVVTGDEPSYFKGDATNPVECVSWFDAVRF